MLFPENYIDQIDSATAKRTAADFSAMDNDARRSVLVGKDLARANTHLKSLFQFRLSELQRKNDDAADYFHGYVFGFLLLDEVGCQAVLGENEGAAHVRSYQELMYSSQGLEKFATEISEHLEGANRGYHAGLVTVSESLKHPSFVMIGGAQVYLAMNSATQAEAMNQSLLG